MVNKIDDISDKTLLLSEVIITQLEQISKNVLELHNQVNSSRSKNWESNDTKNSELNSFCESLRSLAQKQVHEIIMELKHSRK
jgi:hypothetical protein